MSGSIPAHQHIIHSSTAEAFLLRNTRTQARKRWQRTFPLAWYGVADQADAASPLCSAATVEPEADSRLAGLRKGSTSACPRRSILPITGRSACPAADNDTNRFSLHKRSINRCCHGRSTCWGSEKKFRNVQMRHARSTRFGCTYRGPIGVSSAMTPSVSFSIHMFNLPANTAREVSALKAGYYCTRDGALGSNLFVFLSFF
jgi:hypothetical protein